MESDYFSLKCVFSSWKCDCGTFKPSNFGCGYILPYVDALSKQKCVMRRVMRKQREIKLIRYAACMIDINKYYLPYTEKSKVIKLVRHLCKNIMSEINDRE